MQTFLHFINVVRTAFERQTFWESDIKVSSIPNQSIVTLTLSRVSHLPIQLKKSRGGVLCRGACILHTEDSRFNPRHLQQKRFSGRRQCEGSLHKTLKTCCQLEGIILIGLRCNPGWFMNAIKLPGAVVSLMEKDFLKVESM